MKGNAFDKEEIRILCAEDCGNAPKKILIRDYEIAVAKNAAGDFLPYLANHCVWEIIGERELQGVENIQSTVQEESSRKPIELHIENILTHGTIGAANGTMKYQNSSLAFCNIYHFTSFKNAKIKRITSYRISMP